MESNMDNLMKSASLNYKFISSVDKNKQLEIDVDIYDENQLWQIVLGMKAHIDVTVYANPNIDYVHMFYAREALQENRFLNEYIDMSISGEQLEVIKQNTINGNNYVSNQNTNYSMEQSNDYSMEQSNDYSMEQPSDYSMEQSANSMEQPKEVVDNSISYEYASYGNVNGMNVTSNGNTVFYPNIAMVDGVTEPVIVGTRITLTEMSYMIQLGAPDISYFNKHSDYSMEQFKVIVKGIRLGVSVFWYANPALSEFHMNEILNALCNNLDYNILSYIASPYFTYEQINYIVTSAIAGKNVYPIINNNLSVSEMEQILYPPLDNSSVANNYGLEEYDGLNLTNEEYSILANAVTRPSRSELAYLLYDVDLASSKIHRDALFDRIKNNTIYNDFISLNHSKEQLDMIKYGLSLNLVLDEYNDTSIPVRLLEKQIKDIDNGIF